MEEEELQIRSEAVQDILERVPNWMIRWGSLLFLGLILLLLFLSYCIKYPDIITAKAVITTEIPPQKEYAQVDGKLAALLVAKQKTVAKGTPLAVIENNANYKDVLWLQQLMDTISINSTAFQFPLASVPVMQLGSLSSDYALFEAQYLAYTIHKELDPLAVDAANTLVSAKENKSRLQTLVVQKQLVQQELNFKQQTLSRFKKLFEKGVIAPQEYENKQAEYLDSKKRLQELRLRISNLKEGVSKATSDTKNIAITRKERELLLLKKAQQQFQNLKSAISQWCRTYVLQADIEGTAIPMGIWNENQNVTKGDPVFTILPAVHSNYIAKLTTPVQNAGKIQKGQKVLLKIANYPEQEFGVLQGTVAHITAIANQEGFYAVDVQLEKKLITSYQKEIPFTPEMLASADIITEDLRLLQRLFYQFRSLWKRS